MQTALLSDRPETRGLLASTPSTTCTAQSPPSAVTAKSEARVVCLGDVGKLAQVMQRSWEAKKQTASQVSTSQINVVYETALKNGALAGKSQFVLHAQVLPVRRKYAQRRHRRHREARRLSNRARRAFVDNRFTSRALAPQARTS